MSKAGRPRRVAVSLPGSAVARSSADQERASDESRRRTNDYQRSLNARIRAYGVSPGHAAAPILATPEGRMSVPRMIDGRRVPALLTERQREAASAYRRVLERYSRAVEAPPGPASVLGQMQPRTAPRSTGAGEALAQWRYDEARQALMDAGAAAAIAVDRLVRRNDEPGRHMLAALRRGLDALVAHFGLEKLR